VGRRPGGRRLHTHGRWQRAGRAGGGPPARPGRSLAGQRLDLDQPAAAGQRPHHHRRVAGQNGDQIWTAGLTQAVYRSLDSGVTWSAIDAPVNQPISSLSFSDAQHGWMVTSDIQGASVQSNVSFSGDQGATWTEKYVASGNTFLDTVSAFDADHAVIGGSGGFVAATKDGGGSWSEAKLPGTNPMAVSRLTFTDADTGWALTSNSILYATTDGSLTWVSVKDLKEDGHTISGVTAVVPEGAESAQLWVAGDANGKGVIQHSDDGGATWEQVDAGDVDKLFSIDMMGGLGLATGATGQLVISEDAGRSWSAGDAPLATNIYQGTILADGRELIAGQNGLVATSLDGGYTWSRLGS
jgi:photosystem II stability/assembly factor-like uncharacterized protein